MKNYDLTTDEVILYNGSVYRDDIKGNMEMTLTSKKIVFEQKKLKKISLFKSETTIEVVNKVALENIKTFNGKAQVQQKGNGVYIQTLEENFTINFISKIEARKFMTKITDALTGTTIIERGSKIVKETFNKVDDVLGIDTRDTIKGVIEKGIADTLLKGIKRTENKKIL